MSMHPTRNLFAEFKGENRVLVETGSYRGDGIQLALDAGYERIFSIDSDPECIQFCKDRFDLDKKPDSRIKLVQGDSAIVLWAVIFHIAEPITFWLDSHWQMLEGTEPGKNPFPLYDELDQINDHIRQDHTLLIDDWLYMTHPKTTGFSDSFIKEKIAAINPLYKFELFANPIINNLLVAHL